MVDLNSSIFFLYLMEMVHLLRKIIRKLPEQIRNASDYDDFYVASKEETRQQVENAEYLVRKIGEYIGKESL